MAKKRIIQTVQCLTCNNAMLRQRGNDPIIAECSYTGYKEVAGTYRLCYGYVKGNSNKPIKKIPYNG